MEEWRNDERARKPPNPKRRNCGTAGRRRNPRNLKGAASRGFCCLGQCCAKIYKAATKISNEFYQRGLNPKKISWNWPILSRFNSFPPMPSVATGDRKQFQHLQIIFTCNNKTRSLGGIENKRGLQTLSIDNAWFNKMFLYYLMFRIFRIERL